MDLRKVKKLIELLEESTLSEMEITEGDDTIRLSRVNPVSNVVASAVPQPISAPSAPVAVSSTVTSANNSSTTQADHIRSPMVGTFYDSASPDTPPFVSVGTYVNEGDVVCIIEAMKTFNEVRSPISGKIVELLKSAGDAVEFDEYLFVIE